MFDIALHSHLESTRKRLEDTFYLVVFVSALSFYIEIHASGIGETLEEMQEHLRRHLSHLFSFEFGIPHKPRSATEVQRHLTETVVHWQTVTVTLYTAFVAQSLEETLAES